MKNEERSASREHRAATVLLAGTLAALVLFGSLLWLAIISIDGANGLYKTSPGAPESLVSLGAPRSQLDLERMFSSMSNAYTEGGKSVCEPVTASYRESVNARISKGERFALSVEEVLYIISDSVEAYSEYDLIRLVSADGSTEREIAPIAELSESPRPYYDAATQKARDILAIITHRIFSLSSPDAITESDGVYVYTPEYKEKDSAAKSFTIAKSDAEDVTNAIAFKADSGRAVTLYPTEKMVNDTNSTVLCESKRALGRAEREVLSRSGYDPDACRNVTPEYFYGKTDMRLVAVGGRIIVVDVDSLSAIDPLTRDERFASVALCEGDLYITSTVGDGSAVWHYKSGESADRIATFEEKHVGVYSDGDRIGVYAAKKKDSGKYISVLVREGEPLMTPEK